MVTSTLKSLKLGIITAIDLSRDALHIYVGLALMIAASYITRKPLGSFSSWLVRDVWPSIRISPLSKILKRDSKFISVDLRP
ncbi:hypothetical protein QF043_002773 [Pseudomonas sp. W3I7]|jgi:hypothetical protein|uniref:hypothetical protein n=1 Tax=Pseudomonas sp. W3I7 TaxID=3042292 RepID=UPI00278FD64E|nr:hypothetical protein [Pseudomonas sp. W3I7]MDQ0703981.1 hypothetical protein [Pseudomonas sp. W3I7]